MAGKTCRVHNTTPIGVRRLRGLCGRFHLSAVPCEVAIDEISFMETDSGAPDISDIATKTRLNSRPRLHLKIPVDGF